MNSDNFKRSENKDLKIFIGHGTEDNVIGYNIAKNSYERILGYKNVIFKTNYIKRSF